MPTRVPTCSAELEIYYRLVLAGLSFTAAYLLATAAYPDAPTVAALVLDGELSLEQARTAAALLRELSDGI